MRPPGARNGAVGEHDVIADDVESVHGGWGNDVIHGDEGRNGLRTSTGADRVYGGGGNDVLWSSSGYSNPPDEMHGEAGDDFFFTGPLPGLVDGGPGHDEADIEGEPWYASLTLDGLANDGGLLPRQPDPWNRTQRVPDGELREIESVWGGELNDLIVGDAEDNELFGMSGSDVLVGGGGSDDVYDDADYYSRGDDFIFVLDGERDRVYCGNGVDTVVADKLDWLANDECDHVTFEELPIPELKLPDVPPLPDPPIDLPPVQPPIELPPVQPPGLPLPDPWLPPGVPPPPGRTGPPPRASCPMVGATRKARTAVGGVAAECLVGGLGTDSVQAGSGDDLVIASDGVRDEIDCGKGRDSIVADRADRVKRCEVVRRTRPVRR